MKTIIKTGDKVYEIGVTYSKGEASISEMKVLCVGEKTIYVSGPDADLNFEKETIYTISKANTVDPSKVVEREYQTIWANSLEKANELKATIEKILQFKNQFKNLMAS